MRERRRGEIQRGVFKRERDEERKIEKNRAGDRGGGRVCKREREKERKKKIGGNRERERERERKRERERARDK